MEHYRQLHKSDNVISLKRNSVLKMKMKGIVLLLTFLSFSNLNLADSDQFKESQPKFDTSHYPWIEVPSAVLVLALSTFLNLAIINYINNKSPVSLSLTLILYRDSFGILMVSKFYLYNYFNINGLPFRCCQSVHQGLVKLS